MPPRVRFTTWTLRYNHSYWVQVDELEHHWERARIDAELPDGHRYEKEFAEQWAACQNQQCRRRFP